MSTRVFVIFFVFLFLGGININGQGKTWVFFSDKGPDAACLLENPQDFLSPAALRRRAVSNVPVDYRDLPVCKAYEVALRQAGIRITGKSRWLNAVSITTDTDLEALRMVCPAVTGLRPVGTMIATGDAETKTLNRQAVRKTSSLLDYGDALDQTRMIGLDYLHDRGFTGEGITIAILDAGFFGVDTLAAFDSVRNAGNLLAWYDFVDRDSLVFSENYHGEAVFSLLGANLPGDFVGTAPHASYVLARTEEVAFERHIEEDNWVEAMEWADSIGVHMIQNSLGYNEFDPGEGNYTYADMDGNTAIISRAADVAASRGILVVTSAGNEGTGPWLRITAPCDADSVLCVGAVDGAGFHAAFSSYGPSFDGQVKPDVVAWGQLASLVGPSGTPGVSNGTSFSAPQVCGLAACLWQAHPLRSNMEVIQAIRESADRYLAPDTAYGYGIPNARLADSLLTLLDSLQISVEAPGAFKNLQLYPNPAGNYFRIAATGIRPGSTGEIRILDLSGREFLREEVDFRGEDPQIFCGNLSHGIFLVELELDGGSRMTGRLLR